MMGHREIMKAIAAVVVGATVAAAQTPSSQEAEVRRLMGDAIAARRAAEQRYQIGQMERVLEGAVEHGVTVTRDRLQALAQVPADLLVSDNAHARGFRLEGYGVFFDVVVPSFETTLTWTLRTLDRNDLGLDSAWRALQSHIQAVGDPNLEQALKRVELQVNPAILARSAVPSAPSVGGAATLTGSAASTTQDKPVAAADDPILSDTNEAYRTEVIDALKDAMLAHSSALGIGPSEWLTIAAKGNDDRPRLAPADSDARTRVIRLRGSDLADFLAGRITRDEALQRIEVRVF
jgi:hypothetical protein